MKHLKSFFLQDKIFIDYSKKIEEYNSKTSLVLSVAFATVLFLMFVFNAIYESSIDASTIYFAISVIFMLFSFYAWRLGSGKHSTLFAYLLTSVVYAFLIFMSVIISPAHRAGAILGAFSLMPTLFVDKNWRVIVYNLFVYFVHTYLSFSYKGHILGSDDMVHCFAFLFGGLMFGVLMNQARLKSFRLEGQLEKQRDFDYLTGLGNRRKMFELITDIDNGKIKKPSCVMMIDVDRFKIYNDTHGHAFGDRALNKLGALLLELESQYEVKFYRYGGEEIAACFWNFDFYRQLEMGELIRVRTNELDLEYKITVSIGLVNCIEYPITTIEKSLELADKSLYLAKSSGRNQVIVYNKDDYKDDY